MEKAAQAGRYAGPVKKFAPQSCAVLALASLLCPALRAQDAGKAPAQLLVAEGREPAMRLQLQTSTLPRLDAQDSGFQAPRIDLTVTPMTLNGSGLGAVFGLATPAA